VTAPDAAGRARPLRIAGLALLGLAVGALLVALVTLSGQDGDGGGDGAAGATSTSATPADTPATDTPATGTDAAATPAPAPATTTPPPPVITTAAPSPAPPPPPPPPSAPVRVFNNSTIDGLAAQAADDFRRDGWQVTAVDNYPNARIPTSTVYFRPGTPEEAAAQRLGTRFNLRVEPRFEGIAGASPGLIVIVTNDYGSK